MGIGDGLGGEKGIGDGLEDEKGWEGDRGWDKGGISEGVRGQEGDGGRIRSSVGGFGPRSHDSLRSYSCVAVVFVHVSYASVNSVRLIVMNFVVVHCCLFSLIFAHFRYFWFVFALSR